MSCFLSVSAWPITAAAVLRPGNRFVVPCALRLSLHTACFLRAVHADFVLGMDMRVQQVGSALEHLVPELHQGVHVREALQVQGRGV